MVICPTTGGTMYYLTFDGDDKTPVGTSLSKATDAFWEAVSNNDWCPGLQDEDGVVLIAFANDTDEGRFTTIIGPEEDPNPEPGIDRAWEENYYRYGSWRL
jgi:hypothetical protein